MVARGPDRSSEEVDLVDFVDAVAVDAADAAPADAARCFETAIDLQPQHTKAFNYLGLALAQLGEFGRAKDCFTRGGNMPMAEKMAQAEGKPLAKGDLIGIIRLGSQVSLILPKNVSLRVKTGQKVKGGETVIGMIESPAR